MIALRLPEAHLRSTTSRAGRLTIKIKRTRIGRSGKCVGGRWRESTADRSSSRRRCSVAGVGLRDGRRVARACCEARYGPTHLGPLLVGADTVAAQMHVPVMTDLVTGGDESAHHLWVRLRGMARHEERRRSVEPRRQVEDARDAAHHAVAPFRGRGQAPVVRPASADPSGLGVHLEGEAMATLTPPGVANSMCRSGI